MATQKIKELFNGRYFDIPKYQRGYAWERENVRELFDDVYESLETNSSHYIGTVVLSKHPDCASSSKTTRGYCSHKICCATNQEQAVIDAIKPLRSRGVLNRFG